MLNTSAEPYLERTAAFILFFLWSVLLQDTGAHGIILQQKGEDVNKSNRLVQGLGEISVGPHPDCDD